MSIRCVRLLLIEDSLVVSETLLNLFANEFEGVRFLPVVARTLVEGVAAAQSGSIDCIITDLALPDSDGVETLVAVKKVAQAIPVFVLSGTVSYHSDLEMLCLGAEDCMEKGRELDILRTVRSGLERFWSRQTPKTI